MHEGAPSSSAPVRLTVRGSSPVGVASLIGAVGDLSVDSTDEVTGEKAFDGKGE